MKVVLDTDPGVDDAIAILMALVSPDVEVAGITTVGGNVPLARSTRNALALLQFVGRSEVPVARGASRPLRGQYGYSYHVHGGSGLSRRLPEPTIRPVSPKAVDFLAKTLQSNPGEITVVALGPLTNLALLLERYPTALNSAAALVIMGGAVEEWGNVTPYAEFNFYSDPVAAHRVLSAGIPLTLVDLRACRKVSIQRKKAEGLRAETKTGVLAAQLLVNWFRIDPSRQRFEFYDPLALAVAVKPNLVSNRRVELAVELSDQERLGESKVISGRGTAIVPDGVDSLAFFGMLDEIFQFRHR